ncbi:pleiotropic drug resistance protein [Striga asiatica]|uniref:Pleiotropic drug resistance protein n=1 Tax=Striga asiatica TaxID=4170 RepID=A0A5A7PJR0_STRAF|nr:pleiotropic drug resistance protein [Striga asiatica]
MFVAAVLASIIASQAMISDTIIFNINISICRYAIHDTRSPSTRVKHKQTITMEIHDHLQHTGMEAFSRSAWNIEQSAYTSKPKKPFHNPKECEWDHKTMQDGHGMQEFVPQRSAAYIGQHDAHIGEMTVRETLAFSARCQGVGSRYEMLAELSRREKTVNIKPDPYIDILKSEFKIHSPVTKFKFYCCLAPYRSKVGFESPHADLAALASSTPAAEGRRRSLHLHAVLSPAAVPPRIGIVGIVVEAEEVTD